MTAASDARPTEAAMASEPVSPDIESRACADHHSALRLWLRLLTCTNLIESDVRRRLTQRFSFTLPRFDLMAQLDRCPDGLTMSALSKRMMVTGGNVTGITDQVEREGYVAREVDPSDRRVVRVRLTEAGRQAFAAMAAEHEAWIKDLMGGLSEAEIKQLLDLLGRLKTHVNAAKTT